MLSFELARLQIPCAEWYIAVLVHALFITPKGVCDVSRDLHKSLETNDNLVYIAR